MIELNKFFKTSVNRYSFLWLNCFNELIKIQQWNKNFTMPIPHFWHSYRHRFNLPTMPSVLFFFSYLSFKKSGKRKKESLENISSISIHNVNPCTWLKGSAQICFAFIPLTHFPCFLIDVFLHLYRILIFSWLWYMINLVII